MVMLLLRKLASFNHLLVEVLILLINPMFGLFDGLGHVMEVCWSLYCELGLSRWSLVDHQ